MAKQGMSRPEWTHTQPNNQTAPVPELQGKAKTGKKKANPIVAGTAAPSQKVWHTAPHTAERPISGIYAEIDNDLARDNLENDIPEPDLP